MGFFVRLVFVFWGFCLAFSSFASFFFFFFNVNVLRRFFAGRWGKEIFPSIKSEPLLVLGFNNTLFALKFPILHISFHPL